MPMAEADFDALARLPAVPEAEIADGVALDSRLEGARTPFVVRGLVADWPLVRAGRNSAATARAYLLDHARDRPFAVNVGMPGGGERLFYDSGMGMNFRMGQGRLADIFAGIEANEGMADAPLIYLSSVDVGAYFEGLAEANPTPLGGRDPIVSIWIGTRTRIAAHNDFPHNLACCAVGRRRFILFPPEQYANLYLGPIDHTPAGRAVSMVDFAAPDFAEHGRFREALAHAQAAELAPGDAIFIPSMWWHHVEGLEPFNVLVNYWWRDTPRWLGQPQDALYHAILAVRDLPAEERKIWRELFDHYVFSAGEDVVRHIPEDARGVLAPLDAAAAGRLRNVILRNLSR
jgi:hypothetical protein